jgi:hypothetical protein
LDIVPQANAYHHQGWQYILTEPSRTASEDIIVHSQPLDLRQRQTMRAITMSDLDVRNEKSLDEYRDQWRVRRFKNGHQDSDQAVECTGLQSILMSVESGILSPDVHERERHTVAPVKYVFTPTNPASLLPYPPYSPS